MLLAGLLPLLFTPACTVTLPFDTLTGGAPLPTTLYSFDTNAGSVAVDWYGKNQGAFMQEQTPPQWTKDGKRGGGLKFVEDGWINVPRLSLDSAPKRATVALWIRVTKFTTDDDPPPVFGLEQEENPESDEDNTAAVGLYVMKGEVLLSLDNNTNHESKASTDGILLDEWALLVIGWDVEAGGAFLYVRRDGTAPYPIQRATFPAGFQYRSPQFNLQASDGTLDEIRYYDRVLNEAELALLD